MQTTLAAAAVAAAAVSCTFAYSLIYLFAISALRSIWIYARHKSYVPGPIFPSSNHDTIYIKWTNMYPYHELHALTKLTNIISQIYIYQTHACYVLRVRCAVSFDECESKHLKTTVFMTTTWGWSSFVVTQRIRIGCFLSPFWHFDIPTDSTASASCFSR